MLSQLLKDKKSIIFLLLFIVFSTWWVLIQLDVLDTTGGMLDWFAGTYGVVALLGGFIGLNISRKWGSGKSVIGRAILIFSIGLLLQEFGQLVYAYYAIVSKNEIPYPSLGDIGYFGSVLFYIYGAYLLAHAAGTKFSLNRLGNKLLALLIPAALLVSSYLFFLKGYEFDWSQPVTIFLDFGYPFGQAIYIAIAIVAFLLSRKLLGGVMRSRILLIILALVAQYAADFNFLFQANRETWSTAAYGDYLYLVSYLIMSLALISFATAYKEITEKHDE